MIAFSLESLAVSGAPGVRAFTKDLRGIGPVRIVVRNTGANALTAAAVKLGPTSTDLYDADSVTFASVAAGASAGVAIPAPVGVLALQLTSAGGTTVNVSVETPVGIGG